MPSDRDGVAVLRLLHFGNWLRVATDFGPGSASTVLVTIYLKA